MPRPREQLRQHELRQKYFQLNKCATILYEMAAASYSSDVLQRYYGRIDEAIQNLPRPLVPSYDYGQIDKAIQNLPPELREIICKEYVAIKQKERAALGWKKVNEDILKKPFCYFMQQIVPVLIPLDDLHSSFEGYCFCCLVGEKRRLCLHEVSMKAHMDKIPLKETRQDYEAFLDECVVISWAFNQKRYRLKKL